MTPRSSLDPEPISPRTTSPNLSPSSLKNTLPAAPSSPSRSSSSSHALATSTSSQKIQPSSSFVPLPTSPTVTLSPVTTVATPSTPLKQPSSPQLPPPSPSTSSTQQGQRQRQQRVFNFKPRPQAPRFRTIAVISNDDSEPIVNTNSSGNPLTSSEDVSSLFAISSKHLQAIEETKNAMKHSFDPFATPYIPRLRRGALPRTNNGEMDAMRYLTRSMSATGLGNQRVHPLLRNGGPHNTNSTNDHFDHGRR